METRNEHLQSTDCCLLSVRTQVTQQLSRIKVTSYNLPPVLIESPTGRTGHQNQGNFSLPPNRPHWIRQTVNRYCPACLVAGINYVSYLFLSFAIYFKKSLGRGNLMIYAATAHAFCYIFNSRFFNSYGNWTPRACKCRAGTPDDEYDNLLSYSCTKWGNLWHHLCDLWGMYYGKWICGNTGTRETDGGVSEAHGLM